MTWISPGMLIDYKLKSMTMLIHSVMHNECFIILSLAQSIT